MNSELVEVKAPVADMVEVKAPVVHMVEVKLPVADRKGNLHIGYYSWGSEFANPFSLHSTAGYILSDQPSKICTDYY